MTTILVADDEPSLRMLVRATLSTGQYTIVEAADGDEAWQVLCEQRPPVALLDVQMPERDGLELTRAIKTHPQLADTRVILLTAQAQSQDIEAGIAAGADRYIIKPFLPQDLLAAVAQVLEQHRTARDMGPLPR